MLILDFTPNYYELTICLSLKSNLCDNKGKKGKKGKKTASYIYITASKIDTKAINRLRLGMVNLNLAWKGVGSMDRASNGRG